MTNEIKVLIIMGSDSDLPIMNEAAKALEQFNIGYEKTIASAHRSPKRTSKLASEARDNGIEVIIAGAGAAAHLAGVIASETTLPIIGVPIDSSPLKGMDALLATVQMPGGIPVASMAIGKAGAKNAGIFAAEILSIKYPEIADKLATYREDMAKAVEEKAERVKAGQL
ncbi:MAG: 5-(carboxyamino)imidazole ribonucleotide mutase [Proteobacteria bacterium]|nr:5-(carboxyamino)imidazole ribonucleotide mutase [Pseudomonadota bacterium]